MGEWKTMKRTIIIILIVILLAGTISVYPVIFQEGNPLPILKGIIKLGVSDDNIVQISNEPRVYISKASVGNTHLIELIEKEGWNFEEQLGSGYIFSRESKNLVVGSVQYTRRYRIWKVSN